MTLNFFRSLSRMAIRHPRKILGLAALITLATVPGLLHLTLRTDGHALVSPSAPEVITDKDIRSHFGIHDQLLVRIKPEGTNEIFNAHTLQLVRALTAAFKTIPGVGPADVISLATEPSFRLRPGTLTQMKMLEPQLVSTAELARLREDLQSIKLYTGALVALNGQSTVILVGVPDSINREQFYRNILQLIAAQKSDTDQIAVTGAPVAESLFGSQILEDLGVPRAFLGDAAPMVMGKNEWKIPGSLHELRQLIARHLGLVPLSALVMMLVLLVCFRNPLAALLPLPGVAATMIFVFGLMGWFGVPIYLTTAVMPVLLTVISVTNDIYLFSRYFNLLRENPGADHVALLEETFQKLTRPVVCTSFAAVIGFLSFSFSTLLPVRSFGLFTGVGALFGLFLSLTVVPALLVLTNPNWLRPRANQRATNSFATLAKGFALLGNAAFRHRRWVIGAALVILALTPFGLRRLTIQDSWTNSFAPESEFRRVTESVNDEYFGMHLLYVCAESTKPVRGEITADALNGSNLALPLTLVSEPATIIGSSITFRSGEAEWRTHIELANASANKMNCRLAQIESTNHFLEALAKTGRAQFEITLATHIQAELIRALGALGSFIRTHQQEAVGGVLGPVDYLTTTRFMVRTGDPDARRLPDTAVEFKIMWDYYALALGQARLRQVVDANYSQSLTTIFLKDANFQDTARLMRDIRAYEQKYLAPLGIKLSFAGDVAVSQSLIGGIVNTQLQSLFWSLLGIFLVTALLGGAWRWGLFCLLPSLLAVVIKFAVMGWTEIPLGVATSMFAAMTLGIGVNCAIHLLEGFDQARAAGQNALEAMRQSLRFTGPPALVNTLSVSLGFGVLMLSQVPANARLGLLLVLGLVNCFIVSVLLLPVLLAGNHFPARERPPLR